MAATDPSVMPGSRVDRTHRHLRWGTPRGIGSGMLPWSQVLFSLPFVGMGGAIIAMAVGRIRVVKHGPDGVIAAIGLAFVLAGLLFLGRGLRAQVRRWRQRRMLAQDSQQPWLADYPWNPQGISDAPLTQVRRALMLAAVFSLLLVPANWVGFGPPHDRLFAVISTILDAALITILGVAGYHLWRYLKYGRSYLYFDQCPYFAGQLLAATLRPGRAVTGTRKLTLTLRCVQEVVQTTGTGRDRSEEVVRDQIYAETVEVQPEPGAGGLVQEIPVTFLLPEDAAATDLANPTPRYWELEVKADTPGVDFAATFLVPVYRRAEAGR